MESKSNVNKSQKRSQKRKADEIDDLIELLTSIKKLKKGEKLNVENVSDLFQIVEQKVKSKMTCHFDRLPNEIVLRILDYTRNKQAPLVCRLWRNYYQMWKHPINFNAPDCVKKGWCVMSFLREQLIEGLSIRTRIWPSSRQIDFCFDLTMQDNMVHCSLIPDPRINQKGRTFDDKSLYRKENTHIRYFVNKNGWTLEKSMEGLVTGWSCSVLQIVPFFEHLFSHNSDFLQVKMTTTKYKDIPRDHPFFWFNINSIKYYADLPDVAFGLQPHEWYAKALTSSLKDFATKPVLFAFSVPKEKEFHKRIREIPFSFLVGKV